MPDGRPPGGAHDAVTAGGRDGGRAVRVAHLTTVDMSLALLLGTELAVDVEAGLDTYGISAPGPYVEAIREIGVTHVPVPALTRRWDLRSDLAAARQVWEALRRVRPDILHTHTPKAGVLGRIVGRAARVPVVVNTCHGLWAGPEDPLPRRALVYAAEALAARFSHAELYQNDTDRRRLARAVPRHRARTVGNGVDLDRFRPDPEGRVRVRRELGVGADDLLVGGVGRRVREKGIVELAAAARALSGKARFVWVGPQDPDKPDSISASDEELEFVGERSDMPAVYSALDVFALPSYREGFSRSAMEAAATGCALVLSDIRGCREIGEHGVQVLLVPPRDPVALTAALGRVLDDAGLRQRLGGAARQRALDAFDQREVAVASLETYRIVGMRRGVVL